MSISPINRMIMKQRNQVEHEKGRLFAAAHLLHEQMAFLMKECDRDNPIVDNIGAVHDLGNKVDAACGRFCAARDALEEMIAHAD